jgi:hypothetical protein
MADAVATRVVQNSEDEYVIHLTNISDSTGESAVVKIDKSTLTNINGAEPARINILSIRWAIQGFTYVKLLWDHTTDDVAMLLNGNGYDDFSAGGGLRDPSSAGGTGDLLLTTVGATATSTYDITITCSLQ